MKNRSISNQRFLCDKAVSAVSNLQSQISNLKSKILRFSASLRLCGCICLLLLTAAAEPTKPNGFQGLGPLLGQAPSLPPPPYKIKWTWKVDDKDRIAIIGSPIVVGDTIYLPDAKGTLHSINLQSGKSNWKYPTENGFETTPLFADNKIFLGDLAGIFHCISTDGKKLWTIDAGAPIHSSANFFDNKIIFGTDGAEIFCLDAKGNEIWRAKAGDRVNSAPGIEGGKAFISGCDAQLRAIDIVTGKELFAAELPAPAPGSPACLPDRIIIGTDRGHVIAISPDGKKTLWDYDKIEGEALVQSSPAIADNIIVIGAHDRTLHAIDAQTGQPKWTFKTRGDIDASPLISDGRVYIGSHDRHFYVLDLKTGDKLWEFTAARSIESSAAIASNLLLFADSSGTLYCLQPM